MLEVPQQQYIKFLYEYEDLSIAEIAARIEVDWRTAKKYAVKEDWSPSFGKRKKARPVMGPYMDIVDTWLMEDEQLPRKQRHTAKRVFDRLREEHGFQGGQRTVGEYVAKRRVALKLDHAQSYERLEHPGGEAQVDFGTAYVGKQDKLLERKVLIMSFPYSNAAFAFSVRKENTESFLEAMKRIFEQIGHVPKKIWFDNLSAAVVSMGKGGKRTFTDLFLQFAAHYRFQPNFCNAYSGNEKGNVENKVGYSRRNWLVPPPVMDTDADLEAYLARKTEQDMDRPHYMKKERITDLWIAEQPKLLIMPTTPFDVYKQERARLNKYRELQFDKAYLPLPQCKARQAVLLKVRWDEIEVYSDDGEYRHLATLPRPYTEKAFPIDWSAVFGGYSRRPKAVLYSHFAKMMPESVRTFLQVEDDVLRKSRIHLMHRLVETYTLQDIGFALASIPMDHQNPEPVLEHALYAMMHPTFQPEPFAEPHTPKEVYGQIPDLEQYDVALGVHTQ